MSERARFFDHIAGLAGNTLSMFVGLREEIESIVQTRLDETLRRLKLARIDDLDTVQAIAVKARLAQEEADQRLAVLEARLSSLEKTHSLTSPETGAL